MIEYPSTHGEPVPRAAERVPAHYSPFRRNGSWLFTLPYGISDGYLTEADAIRCAELTRKQDDEAKAERATRAEQAARP